MPSIVANAPISDGPGWVRALFAGRRRGDICGSTRVGSGDGVRRGDTLSLAERRQGGWRRVPSGVADLRLAGDTLRRAELRLPAGLVGDSP